MPLFKSLTGHFPLPSADEMEAGIDSSGPFPEFTPSDGSRPMLSMPMLSFLNRSPKAINEKRAELIHGHSESKRSSVDIESQASTEASTLFDESDEPRRRIGARVISDAIIGLSDGLTVPFALTAGLSALGSSKVVVFAGLAELTAGAISMGLGGYLGAKSEEDSSLATLAETRQLVESSPSAAMSSISQVFAPYDLPSGLTDDLQSHLAKSPHLLQFLMHFQHNTPEQEASRAVTCALTIAAGYFLGGFIPLLPYFFVGQDQVMVALWWSLGVMAVSLFVFGYTKTCFTSGWRGSKNVWKGTKGGFQMMIIGGLAAGCAMLLVRLFDGFAH